MPHVFCCATHFGLPSLPVLFCCTTLFFLPSLPLSTLPTCELRSTVSIREYISGFPHSEHRSCLSTREHRSGIATLEHCSELSTLEHRSGIATLEHCSELSTHSGFHSVSSAPVFTREHCSGFSTRSGSTHFYFTREHCFRTLHPLWVYTFLRIILEHHCTQREHTFATIQVIHRQYLQWLTNTRGTISVASMGFGPTSVAHISSLR